MRLSPKLLLTAVTAVLLAEPADNFEVKEVDPAVLTQLKSAETDLTAATEVLKKAQEAVRLATQKRDDKKAVIVTPLGIFEGPCSGFELHGFAAGYMSVRRFRRVEIRGRYALITDGTEDCGMGGIALTQGNGTDTHTVLRNDRGTYQ